MAKKAIITAIGRWMRKLTMGFGYQVSGNRYQVSGIRYQVTGVGCRVSGVGCKSILCFYGEVILH